MNKINKVLYFIFIASISQFIGFAQQYNVIESNLAFRHNQLDSTLIEKGDTLVDNDLVSINTAFDSRGQKNVAGSLSINLPSGRTRETSGIKPKQTMHDLFFPSTYLLLKERARRFINGLINYEYEDNRAAVHFSGIIDYKPGIECSFICNSQPYSSIETIPINSRFDITVNNKTDSVMCIVIACIRKIADNLDLETNIISTIGEKDTIILTPGESITIPSPFVRTSGFFRYYFNLYAGPTTFMLKLNPNDDKYFIVYTENPEELNCIERYYYEDNES